MITIGILHSLNLGNEGLVFARADRGDPDYISLRDRYNEDKTSTVYEDVEDGLARLRSRREVMLVQESILRGFLRSKKQVFHQELKFFARQRPYFGGLILTKNSPLTPALKK